VDGVVLPEVLRGVFNLIFTTSLAAFALSGLMAASIPGQPAWTTDYRQALSAASEFRKPIAVFITKGSQSQLTQGEGLGISAKLLKDGFVALHIDTTTEKGQTLAASLELTEGLIISDKTGALQALRHAGTVSASELSGYLTKFAGTEAVTTTAYRSTGMAAPAVVQTAFVQPQMAPQYVPQYAPAYRTYGVSNFGAPRCPNCR